MIDFEKAFGDFIDRREYDEAENALFSIVRIAFKAGWLAAGGNPPEPQKTLEHILQRGDKDIPLPLRIVGRGDPTRRGIKHPPSPLESRGA